jgi:hypothetical protein
VPSYPPAPWRLAGRVAIVASPRTASVLVLALYGQGSTLRYGEIAGLTGPVVRFMYVDDERSLAGGREIWAVPKAPMRVRWRSGDRTEVDARDADGRPLLRACWAAPRVRLPLPCVAPFVGTLGGELRVASLAGMIWAGPASVELDVPAASPLSALRLGERRLGLAGRLDVVATPPLHVR